MLWIDLDLAVRLAQWDSRARRYDKLVNAVLRRVAKEGDAIAASLDAPLLVVLLGPT